MIRAIKHQLWTLLYITLLFNWRRLASVVTDAKRPDFLIIGTQRGGTTSLFKYLAVHPQLSLPIIKEIHYFDLNWDKSANWYFANFPMSTRQIITGEASPYYLFHPDVPARVYEMLPHIKLIILLRDPVERALSHYYHNRKLGLERRSLVDAINDDLLMVQSDHYRQADSEHHRHFSYVARGLYNEQLSRWMAVFDSEQILLLQSETLFSQAQQSVSQVWSFLGCDAHLLPESDFIPYNQAQSERQSVDVYNMKQQLANFYRPHNQALASSFDIKIENWT